jgi:hypothetical protein
MSKKIVFLIFLISLFGVAGIACLPVGTVSAQQITNPIGVSSLPKLFTKLGEDLGLLVAALGGIMFIVAGLLYMTSAGDPTKLGMAKNALTYAVIGLIVGISAAGIAGVIQDVRNGASTPARVIGNIATMVGNIIVAAGTVMLVVSAIFFLIAGGDPSKLTRARTSLKYAIAGIAIGFAANGIVQLIETVIGK